MEYVDNRILTILHEINLWFILCLLKLLHDLVLSVFSRLSLGKTITETEEIQIKYLPTSLQSIVSASMQCETSGLVCSRLKSLTTPTTALQVVYQFK